MQSLTLDKKLQLLDFKTDSSAYGLLFTEKNYKDDPNVSFDQILILHQAKDLKATAVYFRLIDGRSSIPQIFIYDNSDNSLSEDELNDIHKKLWSSGIVPLYYVFDNTEVKIFNCRKPANKKSLKATPFVDFSLASDAHKEYKKYSADLFQNGTFWELPENSKRFSINNSSYKKLIDGLKKIRDEFVEGQDEKICNKLLVLSIFIKYLEERKDRQGSSVLGTDYFNKYKCATCFCDVLRNNQVIQLFKDLSKDINGKIFELDEDEQKAISKLNHLKLADFFDANKESNNQYVFWNLYDFNYLPVELISRIYEEFIPDRKDITYTPIHLVNFMVDECMPIDKPQKDYKLIDVSCGSGIFLVSAFKRMVQWWQKEEYKKTGQIKKLKINKLKSILKNQIFGVDLEPEAVRLAIFSLLVALCDMLDPRKAWDELTEEKLIDLKENIITKDFFDFIETKEKYNLVIGNPPFNIPVNEKEKYWNEKVKYDWEIPDKNIALAFLQQAMKLLKTDGLLSLVIPSGPLLYNDTIEYRRQFLNKYNVLQIFDFSSLTGVLFEGRNYPVAVVFAQNSPPDDKDILHVTVRRTITAKEKLYFEIDKYDLYYVPKEIATTEQFIWKINQLGGGHLFSLIKRMQGREKRSLKTYLKEKKKKYGWFFGEGYTLGNRSKPASYLTGKNRIPDDKFLRDYIDMNDVIPEEELLFEGIRKKNKKIFIAPHVLIKESPSLPIAFCEEDVIFRNEIVGIYAPEKNDLIELRENIISSRNLYKILVLSKSGRAGVSRSIATINQKDILALPYPENIEDLKLSQAEEIVCDDVLYYGIEQLSKGEEAKVNTKNANKNIMSDFAKVFCASLNSIYKEGSKQFYPLDYIESLAFICQPFAYGDSDNPKTVPDSRKKQIEKGNLEILIDNPRGTNVLYKRIIKLYPSKDMVFLIKPKTLRYWLKSIALRDASEVFTDLVSSGY